MDNKKITLSGFELEPAEKAVVERIIEKYKRKIQEKFGFKEIRLRLKKSKHGKTFLHEVKGTLIKEKKYHAEVSDYNLFFAISEVFEKLISEMEHTKE